DPPGIELLSLSEEHGSLATEVRAAVLNAMGEAFGNPSSSHAAGDRSREQLSDARSSLASLLGCEPTSVVFTSGATEANNTLIRSFSGPGKRIVSTAVEHSSVLAALERAEGEGTKVVLLPVGRSGLVDPEDLREAIAGETALVSIQWVNSETGVVQPVEDFGRICSEAGVPFHTDAAQAIGKLPVNLRELPVDFASIAGHKFHSPPGTGVLYLRGSGDLRGLLDGGDQESGLRAGTENVPGIAGMGCAAGIRAGSLLETITRLDKLRDLFESEVMDRCAGVSLNGGRATRVCNTTNLLLDGVDGQALVARLDQRGIRCSQSSACTNHRPEPSHVLRAMGLSEEEAYASVRFSLSVLNSEEEVVAAATAVAEVVEQVRAFSDWKDTSQTEPSEVTE
ncbi:MAG: cysteine desulfurase family protein, partial [Gemmatimonadetes bacterium]|nr:cysteine desulfurase family protein [Gemmatimonadota bacterium]